MLKYIIQHKLFHFTLNATIQITKHKTQLYAILKVSKVAEQRESHTMETLDTKIAAF